MARRASIVRTAGLALLGIASLAPVPARADEPAKAPAAALETRRIDVAALLHDRREFAAERGPYVLRSDQINDQEHPMFGGAQAEGVAPFGSGSDLIERVRAELPAGTFEAEGTSIAAEANHFLVVRAPRVALEATQALIDRLSREALLPLTIDVVALRGLASAADGEGGLAGAVARGALVPLSGARATSIVGPRFVGRSGGMATYVQDQDVEVAKEAMTPDPIVGAFPDGLAFEARAIVASATEVRLDLKAWLAIPQPVRTAPAVDADPVETVEIEGRRVSATLDLVPGAWRFVPAGGDVVFAARATVRPLDVPAATPPAPPAEPAFGAPGPIHFRMLDARELSERVQNYRGYDIYLAPSNYTPPSSPELRESEQRFPTAALVETLRRTIDPAGWEREGVSLEVKNGWLVARHDEAHLAALERALGAMKEATRRAHRVRADVVTLPLASLPEWWTGIGDGEALLAQGTAGLLARPGARVVDSAALRLASGQRRAAVGGEARSYVGDYDVEIAEKSTIGNPIVKSAFVMLSFDVEGTPLLGGAALACEVRLDRSTWRGSRRIPTRHGTIECPSLGLLRWYGNAVIPLGATRIVAAGIDGGEVTLLLLTVNGA